jgi:hypothetical protein
MSRGVLGAAVGLAIGCGAAAKAPAVPAPAPLAPSPTASPAAVAAAPDLAVLSALARPYNDLAAWARVRRGAALRADRATASPIMAFKDAGAMLRLPVIEEAPGWVRLRVRHAHGPLLLWAPAAEISPVVTVPTALATASIAPGVAVELRPGAALTVVEARGDRLRVKSGGHRLTVEGDIPTAAVGAVFGISLALSPDPRLVPPTGGKPLVVIGTVAVRDRPDAAGVVIATATGAPFPNVSPTGVSMEDWSIDAVAVAAAHGGWREVLLSTAEIRARGFVPVGGVKEVEAGEALDALFGPGAPGWVAVPAGSCVYDWPGGEVVGGWDRPGKVPGRLAGEAGWYWVTVISDVGELDVAVPDPATPGQPACPIPTPY